MAWCPTERDTTTPRSKNPARTLLLYTDGLIEARDRSVEDGVTRLQTALSDHAALYPGALLDAVLDALVGDQPADDVAALLVRFHPEDEPRPVKAGPSPV